MADVEPEIENKASEKARQAGKIPATVLVDISRTGWSWMRGPQAMIPALQKILPSTRFAGLGVCTTSLDSADPMQTHLAIATRSGLTSKRGANMARKRAARGQPKPV